MRMPALGAPADFGRLWSCGDEMSSFNATECCTTLCLKDSAQAKWAMSLQQTANLIIHRCLVYNSCGQNRKDPLFRRDCSRPTWRVIQVHSQDIPGLSNFNKERLLIRKYKYEIPGFSTWLNHIEPWKLWITQVFCDRKALKAISETVKRDEAKWGKPLHSRCRNQKLAIASNMRDIARSCEIMIFGQVWRCLKHKERTGTDKAEIGETMRIRGSEVTMCVSWRVKSYHIISYWGQTCGGGRIHPCACCSAQLVRFVLGRYILEILECPRHDRSIERSVDWF